MCITGGSICGDSHTERPWAPTEHRLDIPSDEVVIADCCLCRMPAQETMCRLRCQELPLGDYGDYQERELWPTTDAWGNVRYRPVNWLTYASYYDSTWRIECNPDAGCNTRPRRRSSRHLREGWYE